MQAIQCYYKTRHVRGETSCNYCSNLIGVKLIETDGVLYTYRIGTIISVHPLLNEM